MSQTAHRPLFDGAAEHQLRQIVDNSSAVIYVKDLEGRLRLVNRAFEQVFKVTAEQVIGHVDHEFFPAELADVLRANDQKVVELGREQEFEERLPFNGVVRTYLSSKFPLFDAEGRVTAVCGISTDISSRKSVEEVLRYVALGISAATGNEVFEAIARYMVRSLRADFAFVSRISDEGPHKLTTLAMYYNGSLQANSTYPLSGSPCGDVQGRAFHFVGTGLQALYPNDAVFRAYGVDSYAGYPLFATDGRPLGLIAAGRLGPMKERERAESVLRIFSVRAAAEIGVTHAEIDDVLPRKTGGMTHGIDLRDHIRRHPLHAIELVIHCASSPCLARAQWSPRAAFLGQDGREREGVFGSCGWSGLAALL